MEQPRRSFKLFFALLLLQHCLGQQTSNMYAELQNIYEGIQQGYNRNLRPGETILDMIGVVEMIISLVHVTGYLNLHVFRFRSRRYNVYVDHSRVALCLSDAILIY